MSDDKEPPEPLWLAIDRLVPNVAWMVGWRLAVVVLTVWSVVHYHLGHMGA
jgi:hypothetical protein